MTLADLDTGSAAVLAWLLTYVIHSTILLAVAALAAWRLADQHAWLDVMWKTAVIAPLLTASLNVGAIAVPIGKQWTVPSVTPATIVATAVPGVPEAATAPLGEQPASSSARSRPVRRSIDSNQAMVLPAWPAVAVAAWLTIAMISVLRYLLRLRRVYRVLRSGSPAASDLLEAVEGLRRDAGRPRPIRLTTSARCPVPLALGGQQIVVPQRFLEELDAEQQHAALAHEVAHLARRDPEWRVAIEILERALFVQPLNRLARIRLSDAAEFLCDEWAVQHIATPLALARCLSVVGSWWSPAEELPAGVSAMARSDSAMIRRVTRILNEPAHRSNGPRLPWLAIPVALIAIAAPRVTATAVVPQWIGDRPPFAPTANSGPVPTSPNGENGGLSPIHQLQREWTQAEIAAVRSRLQDYRAGGTFDQRWRRAMADAATRRLADFWIAYTFNTPTHDGDLIFSDSRDGGFTISDGQIRTDGPPLAAILSQGAVPLEGGRIAVVLHYRGTAVDRAGYLSPSFGFDFGRAPIFWLGDAIESESFARVQDLFGQARQEKIQVSLIELASLHSDSNAVIPFLTGLVDRKWPPQIRQEAAEGFDHHHDPRSVEVLMRVARTDEDSEVRAEAAETIGEVQTPQSIPALTELAQKSDDPAVRREAAEAFADQPAAQAVPAIEAVVAESTDEEVLGEAIEALGELDDPAVLPMLLQIANTHANQQARQEAVETIGDLDDARVVEALTRIAWSHADVTVQNEAIDTLADRKDDAAVTAALERIAREHDREEVQAEAIEAIADMSDGVIPPLILSLAESGPSARIRREAIEQMADAFDKIADAQALDAAEQALERLIFNDPDQSVRMEALDALGELPGERARRALQKIIDGHPDARVRREAAEHLRERQE